jgi:DNA-binding NarL/FixJ family response regulator
MTPSETRHPETSLTPPRNVTVLLVDDHTVVRQGTREMLVSHPNIQVVGESGSGENLLGLLKLKTPQVLLLDVNLPGKNGLELLSEIKPQLPDLKIVMFSAHSDIQYIRKALSHGADGYLSKIVSEEELQQAVFQVVEQNTEQLPVLSEDVRLRLKDSPEDPLPGLTAREREILVMVAQGNTNSSIATHLFLSVKTVDSHVAKLIKKLSVSNRSQLTAFAYEQNLL